MLPCPVQVHPVVSRLCAPIQGTDASHIAECLGLDPDRFRGASGGSVGGGGAAGSEDSFGASALDDDSNFVVSV